jgi:poly(U)-binding-splicing factor PUF60
MQKLSRSDVPSSHVVLLRNLVGVNEVDATLEDEVKEKCSESGPVNRLKLIVDKASDEVRIYVEFTDPQSANIAIDQLHGRFFGGRKVLASLYSEDKFNSGVYESF